MTQLNSVNIRPDVNILSVLPHLNYKAWYALAEFVDNSIQSSLDKRKALNAADKSNYQLRVDIQFKPHEDSITIKDNAAGIAESDYQRAFRPAEMPPDASGLSEFGMGMKSAACWFASNWSVRTTTLGENIERTIIFDVNKIIENKIENLDVVSIQVAAENHYTEVRLDNIRKFPRGRTIEKIRDHLSSIYREFIRDGSLVLTMDGESLSFDEPDILTAPRYDEADGSSVVWKKEIQINLGEGKSATGFVAIRKTASTRFAGLALFRRKRLIMGSFDETYRPRDVFGHSNSYAYQRLFGEIHLRGFRVSHTKDGIKWEESEEIFLEKLREELSSEDLPLLKQVQEYRSRKDVQETRPDAAAALQSVGAQLDKKTITITTLGVGSANQTADSLDAASSPLAELPASDHEKEQFRMRFQNEDWIVTIELSYVDDGSDWLDIRNTPSIKDPEPRQIIIRIAMLHPFMAQYQALGSEGLAAVLNIAAALALAEIVAGESGEGHPYSLRRFTNEILRNQMSKKIADV